tara:strand:- start:12163 stop:12798 length:636 start_codon:yes stop_codon:yes gene_type:complete
MDQSNLTIGGIGGDPSGSHPIGDLDVNWAKEVDDKSIKYTANTIISNPGASSADATDTYYSSELCIGTVPAGTVFEIGDTGDAQITACWQYYKQSNSNNFNSGKEVVPGTAADLDAGTWTDVGPLAQDFAINTMVPSASNDTDVMENGVSRLRVKMVVTDAGSNGVAAGLVTAGVAAVNASYVQFTLDKQAKKNNTVSNPVTFGGIGADPS